jgi:hypothetical protein
MRIKQADVLQYLRRPGHCDGAIMAFLSAMAAPLHASDPTCVALDAAIAALEDAEESARLAQLWAEDDAECRRQGVTA